MHQKYEYQNIKFFGGHSLECQKTIDALNSLGEKGWMLVGCLKQTSTVSERDFEWMGLFVREVKP